jgi:hypothetical protein
MRKIARMMIGTKLNNFSTVRLLLTVMVLATMMAGFSINQVIAQNNDDPWSDPTNLSNSGSTYDPRIVIDSNGGIHVIWQDAFAGILYKYYNGKDWSSPYQVTFPFRDLKPELVAGRDGMIFAFWVNEYDILYYSFVRADNFGAPTQWAEPRWLADSAVARNISVDSQGRLHLAYVRTLDAFDTPAGIYYQRLDASSNKWTSPRQLYTSPYIRGLTSELANVQVATTDVDGSTRVYVAWDNRLRNKVLFSSSQDGGKNWDEPIEVARPELTFASTNPFYIRVGASKSKVLLIWQDGDPGSSCTQYYQWSIDGGSTWSDRSQMLDEISGCALNNQFLVTSDELFILESWFQDKVYLLALSGNQWSTPQAQDKLNSFNDPETYRMVDYQSQQSAVQSENNRLFVVGCDHANSVQSANGNSSDTSKELASAGDVWLMSRSLGTVDDWFPKQATWSYPTIIASSKLVISSPILVADDHQQIHAFWTQENSDSTSSIAAIYYSRWSGERWSLPAIVLTSPEGDARHPIVILGPKDRLLAVWNGSDGGIYFSLADAGQASTSSDWATPRKLPSLYSQNSSPDIIIDKTGAICVAYAVPLNEGRGIYLTKSQDEGKTWSEPIQIFNASAAGWEMVNDPHLALTSEGHLHVLWTKFTIPFGEGSQALYYARSEDGGLKWSDAQVVVEKPIIWSELIGGDGSSIYRVWQENINGLSVIFYQTSLDHGVTWSHPNNISSFSKSLGTEILTVDPIGRLHLVQIASIGQSKFILQHWTMVNDRWVINENLNISASQEVQITDLAGVIQKSGKLFVSYIGQVNVPENEDKLSNIYVTSRLIDISVASSSLSAQPTASITATLLPLATPSTSPTLNPTLSPSATQFPVEMNRTSSGFTGHIGPWFGLLIGVTLIVLIIILASYYRWFRNDNLRRGE